VKGSVVPRDRDEDDFLLTIRERPDERAARLVYADWLEERADPRAELIRLEEEMRRLPIAGDRYWQLKPRRNEHRNACDEEWLAELCYGTEYEPVFKDGASDVNGRWRLIREFVERCHKVPLPDVGGQIDWVRRVEQRVGYELPLSVREWIAFLYDLIDADGWDHVFRDSMSLEEVEATGTFSLNEAFSLMIQGESDYHWAVLKKEMDKDDPPVDGYFLEEDPRRFEHDRRLTDHVTTWALLHILLYVDSFTAIRLMDIVAAEGMIVEPSSGFFPGFNFFQDFARRLLGD
jgi:uncharacterized protein (TIGR02996 family)